MPHRLGQASIAGGDVWGARRLPSVFAPVRDLRTTRAWFGCAARRATGNAARVIVGITPSWLELRHGCGLGIGRELTRSTQDAAITHESQQFSPASDVWNHDRHFRYRRLHFHLFLLEEVVRNRPYRPLSC